MTRTLTLAALLLAGAALPAHATRQEPPRQTGGSTSAQAGAQASSRATAAASNRTSVRTNTTATGGRATSSAAGGSGSASASGAQTVTVTQGGSGFASGTQTIRTAPDVAAPAIWSNNPCIISASGSVSVVGFGASIGAGVEDADCTRRANAQLLAALGQGEAAREVLCANREVREAFARIGRPCAGDAQRLVSVSVAPTRIEAPAPVNTSGLSDDACRTLRARGMVVGGCP